MSERQKAYEQAKSLYGKDALLPVMDWARRYGDMLDGADEAPTLNELYEAIDEDRKRSWQTGADAYARGFDEGFASADDWIFQHEDAMRDHGWVKDSRDRRDLLDEIAWLHSELHGAELESSKATSVLHAIDRLRRELSGYHGQLKAYDDLKTHSDRQRRRINELEAIHVRDRDENHKLRELVRDMAAVIWTYDYTSDDDCPPALPLFEDSLRELGIEVEQ